MLFSTFDRYKDAGLLVLRIGLGLSMMVHGAPKLFGGPAGWEQLGGYAGFPLFPTFFGFFGGIFEFGGGLLFAAGLLFRPACVALLVTMLTALVTHLRGGDGFSDYAHALELSVVFAGLLFVGPGRYSVDERLGERRGGY